MTTGPSRMKASIQFRDDKNPLYRLRAPINLLGLPLFSGFSMGESEELGVHIGTALDFGPSFRVSYRPNNDKAPNLVVVKAGLGPWLTASRSFLSLAAEFDLAHEGATRIMLKTNPKFGDFSLKREPLTPKTLGKAQKVGKAENGVVPHSDETETVVETEENSGPLASLRWGDRKAPVWGPKPSEALWVMKVHSELPVGKWCVANCRWGLTLPKELFSGGISSKDIAKMDIPTLKLDKVSLVPAGKGASKKGGVIRKGSSRDLAKLSDDVMVLHTENNNLRKAMDELKTQFSKSTKSPPKAPASKSSPSSAAAPLGNKKVTSGEIIGREETLLRSQAFESLMQEKNGKGAQGKDLFKKPELKK